MVGNPQSVVTQIFSGAPRAIVVGVCSLVLPGVIVWPELAKTGIPKANSIKAPLS